MARERNDTTAKVGWPLSQQHPLADPAASRTVAVANACGRRRSPAAKLFVEDLRAFAWP